MASRTDRFGSDEHDGSKSGRTPFETDRDRVLYSPELRRLAGITQVAGAHEGHVFHNRLTHSLKVAQIGRRVAQYVLAQCQDDVTSAGGVDPDVVETACLCHDVGHPPFGHVAETEIDRIAVTHGLDGFEGNAQSFRAVVSLSIRRKNRRGLELTLATLNAIVKYPWARSTETPKRKKKWGYYSQEKAAFDQARQIVSADRRDKQTLEASIMDWADDVTYAVHDLDDFYRIGFVPLDRVLQDSPERERFLSWATKNGIVEETDSKFAVTFLDRLSKIAPIEVQEPFSGSAAQIGALHYLSSLLIGRFLGCTGDEQLYVRVDPKADVQLAVAPTLRAEVAILKGLMAYYVFAHPSLVAQQVGQREVVRRLFEVLFDAARTGRDRDIIPPRFCEGLSDTNDEVTSVRLAADVICSMTEQQAIAFYGRLLGVSSGAVIDRILS